MKFKYLGAVSAFTMENRQSNMLVEINDKKLLIDAGGDIRFSLKLMGYTYKDINDVYISHLHNDHTGGLEWLGFIRYFSGLPRPRLHISRNLVAPLWNNTLSGGMASLQGKIATLETFFDVNPIDPNGSFTIENVKFQLVQTIHIMDGFSFCPSYGLMFTENEQKIFVTSDTQFAPSQLIDMYSMSSLVFQDCETSPYKSGVHAHYNDLKTLSPEIKSKMWLYHYNDGPLPDAEADGFAGFVKQAHIFDF